MVELKVPRTARALAEGRGYTVVAAIFLSQWSRSLALNYADRGCLLSL